MGLVLEVSRLLLLSRLYALVWVYFGTGTLPRSDTSTISRGSTACTKVFWRSFLCC